MGVISSILTDEFDSLGASMVINDTMSSSSIVVFRQRMKADLSFNMTILDESTSGSLDIYKRLNVLPRGQTQARGSPTWRALSGIISQWYLEG